MVKRLFLAALLVWTGPLGRGHTGEDAAGIAVHHASIQVWAGIGSLLVVLVYIIYAQTHEKPLNPLEW